MADKKVSFYDSLFGADDVTVESAKQKGIPIVEMDPGLLHEFKNHPFKVEDNADFQSLMESIKKYGILEPVVIRKVGNDYEILSGHRRTKAALTLGLPTVPTMEVSLEDDLAQIMVVDANKSRSKFYPSELARAFKMRYEAEKHRGKSVNSKKDTTAEAIGKDYGQSQRSVYNYMKLNDLLPELLYYVDNRKLKCSAAFHLAELSKEMQQLVLDEYYTEDGRFPTVTEAARLKQEQTFTKEWLHELLHNVPEKNRTDFALSDFERFFPDSFTDEEKKDKITELLEQWAKERTEVVI